MEYGCYIGTVIANRDTGDTRNTASMGRVLVLIRGKSDIAGTEQGKNPFGQNICRTITEETLTRVKQSEVWAYVLQPNTGGAQGSYSPGYDYTRNSSDGNYPNSADLGAPANAYQPNSVTDGRIGSDLGSAGINTTANSFTPDNRDGAVKGIFSVPPIGATVAVLFAHGSRSVPVVIGTIHGEESIASIYSTGGVNTPMPDYPGVTQGLPGAQSKSAEGVTGVTVADAEISDDVPLEGTGGNIAGINGFGL